MYDVAIIGAGITGCAIAYELGKYNVKAVIVEKENDVSVGTTKANSAIIHGGYDPKPGTKMAEYNIKGNVYTKELCEKLDVPYKQIGALVVAFSEEEKKTLEELKDTIGIKKTIKDYGVDEKYFLDTLDDMVEQAFNDQCTGANPRYPLMKEIKEIYLKCYYGK